jgi:hypothetical protein
VHLSGANAGYLSAKARNGHHGLRASLSAVAAPFQAGSG